MDKEVKKHKNIARFVAIIGALPGIWFLIATHTRFSSKLQISCGYWLVAMTILAVIWVMYAILIKILLKDISLAHEHAHSLDEKRRYRITHIFTLVEVIFVCTIFGVSIFGFLVTDIQCFISRV